MFKSTGLTGTKTLCTVMFSKPRVSMTDAERAASSTSSFLMLLASSELSRVASTISSETSFGSMPSTLAAKSSCEPSESVMLKARSWVRIDAGVRPLTGFAKNWMIVVDSLAESAY